MWIEFRDELNTSIKRNPQIFGEGKNECKYFQISNSIFTMNGAWGQNAIFRFFSELRKIWLHTKFQSGPTPRSGFLPIYIPFLANIWREYFSSNILTVLYQSELELSYLDQNWAKTRHLLFKTFESSNAMDSPIVQCCQEIQGRLGMWVRFNMTMLFS